MIMRSILQAGVHVLTVSVGTMTNETELRAIATNGDDKNMFHVNSYSILDSLVDKVVQAFCNGASVGTSFFSLIAHYL